MPTGVYDRPLIKKCSYVGCEKQSKAKGMCNTHNERIRRNGTVELLNPPDRRPVVERIMDNIEIVPESGCWIWMGPGGETHGNIKIYGVRTPGRVHRIMWGHVNGPVPSGLQVCHKCDIGFCCNPKHLFIGTQQDNMTDKVNKNRQARGEKIGTALLTSKSVIEIRKSSELYRVLAKRYGVTERTIKSVRTRQNWKILLSAGMATEMTEDEAKTNGKPA